MILRTQSLIWKFVTSGNCGINNKYKQRYTVYMYKVIKLLKKLTFVFKPYLCDIIQISGTCLQIISATWEQN